MSRSGKEQKHDLAADISRIAKLADVDLNWIGDLVRRAQNGDQLAMDELRQVLEKIPDLVRGLGGELPFEIERDLAVAIAGDNVVEQAAIQAAMSIRRSDLINDFTPPIERALVEDVILSWLRYQYAAVELTRGKEESTSRREFLQRQVDGAQRRYLAGIRLLITANTQLSRRVAKIEPSKLRMPK